MDLHKQRLAEMKHQVDTKQPETFDIQLSKGKRAMLEKERQFEIDRVSSASHVGVSEHGRRFSSLGSVC